MFSKEKEFEVVEDKLNDIRIICNRLQIPFIWVAAVKDDGVSTQYKVAADENSTSVDMTKYPCHALVPGSMGIKLQDDKIRDIIKVLNGFKVVASTSLPINPEEFSYSALFPEKNSLYEFDQAEGSVVVCPDKSEESKKSKENPIVLKITASDVLPRIKEDFE